MRSRRGRSGLARAWWVGLDRGQLWTIVLMVAVVLGRCTVGFFLPGSQSSTAPAHYRLGGAGAFTVGIGVTAYTLGLRHAFDADHVAAIDNTTRKLLGEGKRPLSVGFWFSLGHSTVVFALALLLSIGVRSLAGPVSHDGSGLHRVTGWIGTLVSGSFLYVIAALNVVILVGIVRVFPGDAHRRGHGEAALEGTLGKRGLMNRLLGRVTRRIGTPRQMYPVGVLFGLGFDTATEVALLVLAGGAAGAGLPWYAILLPRRSWPAAALSLQRLRIDGSFMSFA